MGLARRSVASINWNIVANLVTLVVLLGRSVLLARWLPVEVFGIYALATSILGITSVLAGFGMPGAFLHRTEETEDEEQAAAVYFTLRGTFSLIWVFLVVLGASVFAGGQLRSTLIALAVLKSIGLHFTQTPALILVRRVVHRRLAVIKVLDAMVGTAIALGLAWQGATLWALLAPEIVYSVLRVFSLYVWRPVWRPRLAWSPAQVRYFLSFGARNLLADVLLRTLDRLDDLWTGFYLGEGSLGLYSRAYAFATYPRRILAAPINLVAGGTYAELKGNRLRLSKAFFRINAFLVRSGFFLAGLIMLVSPEFVRLALGAKWLPMLGAFRLMLIFSLLDPIKITLADLFVAVGQPEQVVKARLVQLVVLLLGLFLLGLPLGTTGVALAVDTMLAIGIGMLLWKAQEHVDFSFKQLFLAPSLALTISLCLASITVMIPGVSGSDWQTAGIKAAAFVPIYAGALFALERKQSRTMVARLSQLLREA